MVTQLADGTRLLIRPIRPDDKPRLAAGLRRLSDRSVYRRFLSLKRRFSAAELRYLTELDPRDHVALVAVRADDPETLVAVARFVRLSGDAEAAEAAIVVADPLQRMGLGTLLALRLAEEARARGISRVEAPTWARTWPPAACWPRSPSGWRRRPRRARRGRRSPT